MKIRPRSIQSLRGLLRQRLQRGEHRLRERVDRNLVRLQQLGDVDADRERLLLELGLHLLAVDRDLEAEEIVRLVVRDIGPVVDRAVMSGIGKATRASTSLSVWFLKT